MTNTELIIEALEYAEESGEDWWEAFDSINHAKRTIRKAIREIPEESQIAYVISESDINISEQTAEEAYISILKNLKEEISNT